MIRHPICNISLKIYNIEHSKCRGYNYISLLNEYDRRYATENAGLSNYTINNC